jgi:pimeloyl-ACP methyl ester carboxylesterase
MLSAAAVAGSVAGLTAAPATKRVPLASSVAASPRPTCILVHGLDSSKETWAGTLGDLAAAGSPAVALDLRGHGESQLGDDDEFSPEALASDVLESIRALRGQASPCVLVGHSMGGKVAMRAAAIDAARDEPRLLASVVIEDMDVRQPQLGIPRSLDPFIVCGPTAFIDSTCMPSAILSAAGPRPPERTAARRPRAGGIRPSV